MVWEVGIGNTYWLISKKIISQFIFMRFITCGSVGCPRMFISSREEDGNWPSSWWSWKRTAHGKYGGNALIMQIFIVNMHLKCKNNTVA